MPTPGCKKRDSRFDNWRFDDWKLDESTNQRIGERMNKLKTFEDLECWQACRELRIFAANVCKKLPKEEEYRLKDQILRSARSTTANLAEGYGRFHYSPC